MQLFPLGTYLTDALERGGSHVSTQSLTVTAAHVQQRIRNDYMNLGREQTLIFFFFLSAFFFKMYSFLAALDLRCTSGLFSSFGERGATLCCGARASHCCRAWAQEFQFPGSKTQAQ